MEYNVGERNCFFTFYNLPEGKLKKGSIEIENQGNNIDVRHVP